MKGDALLVQYWHGSFPFMIALVCAVDLILTVAKEINYLIKGQR